MRVRIRRFTTPTILVLGILTLVLLSSPVAGQPSSAKKEEKGEQVGEVYGKPISRRDVGDGSKAGDKLRQLILPAVRRRYRAAHKSEVEPTKEEIDAATIVFDRLHREKVREAEQEIRSIEDKLAKQDLSKSERKELEDEKQDLQQTVENAKKLPAKSFAVFMLTGWKFEKHLYDTFGGGRIVWQQAGHEALDATRKWLEAGEKDGDFTITDEKLRAEFYRYWTTEYHGAHLIEDPDRIKKEFLEPEWAPKSAARK